MFRCFKSRQKKEEEISSPFFHDNGSALLEELITTFNGRQEIPIRCYTAEELINATKNFPDKVCRMYFDKMYKGFINERQVWVKIFEYGPYSTYNETIRDIAITSQMSQLKNVLKLSGCCLDFEHPALVYEYVEFDTLHNILHNTHNLLPWRNRVKIALDIASTVLYLHTSFQTPIIHRNLKPSNVIIDEHGVAKLINFSFSISLPPGESQVEDELKGTEGFVDPEYVNSGFVTQKTDVYSFGVILLMLVTGNISIYQNFEDEMCFIVDYVKDLIEKDQLSQIIDPKLVNQGFDQQQLQAILDLGMRCTRERGEDRPEMIDVARELRRIEKSVNC